MGISIRYRAFRRLPGNLKNSTVRLEVRTSRDFFSYILLDTYACSCP